MFPVLLLSPPFLRSGVAGRFAPFATTSFGARPPEAGASFGAGRFSGVGVGNSGTARVDAVLSAAARRPPPRFSLPEGCSGWCGVAAWGSRRPSPFRSRPRGAFGSALRQRPWRGLCRAPWRIPASWRPSGTAWAPERGPAPMGRALWRRDPPASRRPSACFASSLPSPSLPSPPVPHPPCRVPPLEPLAREAPMIFIPVIILSPFKIFGTETCPGSFF